MTLSGAKTVTKTTKVINNRTGVTTSRSVAGTGEQDHDHPDDHHRETENHVHGGHSASAPAKTAATVLGEAWITGPNDTRGLVRGPSRSLTASSPRPA